MGEGTFHLITLGKAILGSTINSAIWPKKSPTHFAILLFLTVHYSNTKKLVLVYLARMDTGDSSVSLARQPHLFLRQKLSSSDFKQTYSKILHSVYFHPWINLVIYPRFLRIK